MQFFEYSYLVNQSHSNSYLKYLFILFLLFFLAFVTIKYAHNRINTKYRDLGLIFFLLLIFIIGLQFTNYTQGQSNLSQFSQTAKFVEKLSKDQNVSTNDIMVSSSSLADEMVVKIKNKYYLVNFNSDYSAYQLTSAQLMNSKTQLIK